MDIITYTASQLFRLRRQSPPLLHSTLAVAASLGIIRYRGCRGGKHRWQRRNTSSLPCSDSSCSANTWPTVALSMYSPNSVLLNSPPTIGPEHGIKDININCAENNNISTLFCGLPVGRYQTEPSKKTPDDTINRPIDTIILKNNPYTPLDVARPRPTKELTSNQDILTTKPGESFDHPPVMYILNPCSLGKPHALQQLHADVIAHRAEIVVISETWFTKKHTNSIIQLQGYITHRRDRPGARRGGGVIMYVTQTINSSIFKPINDSEKFEILWIKTKLNDNDLFIAGLYHPPKPNYKTQDLLDFFESTIDYIMCNFDSPIIIMAGDVNKLPNEAICSLGLYLAIDVPTHGGNKLDRLYCTATVFSNAKAVQPTINTKHLAVVARGDGEMITDFNKTRKTHTLRKQTASRHAALLAAMTQVDWGPVYNVIDIQTSFDRFYEINLDLLDSIYPLQSVTVTSRDPSFITPHIKQMLREKNSLMRRGRIERANSLALKIGKAIAAHNSTCLEGADIDHDAKAVWKKISDITGKNKSHQTNCAITPAELNEHYSSTSTDEQYSASQMKHTCAEKHYNWPNEMTVFRQLDQLHSTAMGLDELPFWYLKLGAPILSAPISFLYQQCLAQSIAPKQWKTSSICPVPKIPSPRTCVDYRPISLTPILSRVFERLLVQNFFYPTLNSQVTSTSLQLSDQFAFRPTGSTTSAIVAILHIITEFLTANQYVHVISFDFSRAFDTVRHATLFGKLAELPLPDSVYNWTMSFFDQRMHRTKIGDLLSDALPINSSVVQGSAIGPVAFIINSSDLHPVSPLNKLPKYADDIYLIVPSSNSSSIHKELSHINNWASTNNLKLNRAKSYEMIVRSKTNKNFHPPPPTLDIERVRSLKILGVTINDTLQMTDHVQNTVAKSSQSLYALKILKAHGLSNMSLFRACRSLLISRLNYASPAWAGFLCQEDIGRLQKVLNKAMRWGLSGGLPLPTFTELVSHDDSKLFESVLNNPLHVLFGYLPPAKLNSHRLRRRIHNRQLPRKNMLQSKNFIIRMLFQNSY